MSIAGNMTIKYKLISIIMATCIFALLLAGIVFILWEWGTLRQTMARNLSTQAEMIADNCKAAVAFEDANDAEKTLGALKAETSIVFGGVYGKDGKLFAGYYRNGVDKEVQPSELQKSGYTFGYGFLTVFKPVILGSEIIGTVCLRSDLRPMYMMLTRNIKIIILVMLLVSFIAYTISSKLQSIISAPILSLTESARKIGEGELSHRVNICSEDEIGHLADSFNKMTWNLKVLMQKEKELAVKATAAEIERKRAVELERTNKELTQLLSLHTAILEATADGILVVDLDGRVASNNRKFLQLWHIPDSLAATKDYEKLLAFVLNQMMDPEGFLTEVRRLYSHPEEQSFDFLKFKDGRVFERFSHPQKIGERIIGRVWSFRDITERRLAEEQYGMVLRTSVDGFWITDIKGRFLDVNDAYCHLIGYSRDELLKMGIPDVEAVERPEETVQHIQKIMAVGGDRFETRHKCKDGKIIDIEVSVNYMKEGFGRLFVFLRDISERKKAEQRQDQLLMQLEKTNKELNDLVYIMSHDLKTPLRGISTLVNWLSTDYSDKFDQEGKEQTSLLLNRVERMYNLIDGILQYSEVGRVEEERTQVNLNELLPNVIEIVAPPENITILIENELPLIECEKTRITQVFQCLLGNAVKYMNKPQGQIQVGCVEEDGFWMFSVSDNGPGIEERYFEKIFKLFQTLSPRDEVESTGAGLTVVKKIVEIYGGRIWVESKVGKGSTFFFTLPIQEMGVKNAKFEASIVS